jgi:ABC-type glutathione transport system ATPase component
VAIARAISTRPRIIIADEPTAELDSTTSLQIFSLIRDVATDQHATVITTTHDPMLIDMVTSVVELSDGKVVGQSIESDLLTFGRSRRHEADEALSSPRMGSTAGDFLGASGPRLPIADPVHSGSHQQEPERHTAEPDVSRWSRPDGDHQDR